MKPAMYMRILNARMRSIRKERQRLNSHRPANRDISLEGELRKRERDLTHQLRHCLNRGKTALLAPYSSPWFSEQGKYHLLTQG